MTNLPKRKEQIYITRSHIFAIGITTLSIAILTFALGYKTGVSEAAPKEVEVAPPLLPNVEDQDTLEELIRQIEKSHEEDIASNDYFFPDEVEAQKLPVPPENISDELPATEIRQAADPTPATLPIATIQPPTSGWAVQVSSFPDQTEAKQYITQLQNQGLMPYYVVAEIKGKIWYRVRIGGYATESLAAKGKDELETQLQDSGFIISKAP